MVFRKPKQWYKITYGKDAEYTKSLKEAHRILKEHSDGILTLVWR